MDAEVKEEMAAMRRELAVIEHEFNGILLEALADELKKYNQNQPRVPAGNSDGGQWTSGGGSGGGSVKPKPRRVGPAAGQLPDIDFSEQGLENLLQGAEVVADVLEKIPLPSAQPAARGLRVLKGSKWILGKHKSAVKWENRMKAGGWTKRNITATITKGKKYPAPNDVNKANGATRFQLDNRFVVRDNKTKEILQVSRPKINPKLIEKKK